MAVTSANAATVMITNPSFELGSPSGNGSGVTGWTVTEGGGYQGTSVLGGTISSDGAWYAWAARFGTASKAPAWLNATSFTPVSGDLVTLTVDVGDMGGTGAMTRIQLFDTINNTVYATSDYTPAVEDTWYESSTSYTSTGSEAGPLGIRLMFASGGANDWVSFDNVRLDSTAVPEPTTTALLGLGGLALILRRRK
jgi:hypothetical protein